MLLLPLGFVLFFLALSHAQIGHHFHHHHHHNPQHHGPFSLKCQFGRSGAQERWLNETCFPGQMCATFKCVTVHANGIDEELGMGCVPRHFCANNAFDECERHGARMGDCELCDHSDLCNAKDYVRKASALMAQANGATDADLQQVDRAVVDAQTCFVGIGGDWSNTTCIREDDHCTTVECDADGELVLAKQCASIDFCQNEVQKFCSGFGGHVRSCSQCKGALCNIDPAKKHTATIASITPTATVTQQNLCEVGAQGFWHNASCGTACTTVACGDSASKSAWIKLCAEEKFCQTHAPELCGREFRDGRVLHCESCKGNLCNRASAPIPVATTATPKSETRATVFSHKQCFAGIVDSTDQWQLMETCKGENPKCAMFTCKLDNGTTRLVGGCTQSPQFCINDASLGGGQLLCKLLNGTMTACQICAERDECNHNFAKLMKESERKSEEQPQKRIITQLYSLFLDNALQQHQCEVGAQGFWHNASCTTACATVTCGNSKNDKAVIKLCADAQFCETRASELCKREFRDGRVLHCESCKGNLCNRAPAVTPSSRKQCFAGIVDSTDQWQLMETCKGENPKCAMFTCKLDNGTTRLVSGCTQSPQFCTNDAGLESGEMLCNMLNGTMSACQVCAERDECNRNFTALMETEKSTPPKEQRLLTQLYSLFLDAALQQNQCEVGAQGFWHNTFCANECTTLACVNSNNEQALIKLCADAQFCETRASELCRREFRDGRVLRCESCKGNLCNRALAPATTLTPKHTIPTTLPSQKQCFAGIVGNTNQWQLMETCKDEHPKCAMFTCKLDNGITRLVGGCTQSPQFCTNDAGLESGEMLCNMLNGTMSACQVCAERDECNRNFTALMEAKKSTTPKDQRLMTQLYSLFLENALQQHQCEVGAQGFWHNESCPSACTTVICTSNNDQAIIKLCTEAQFCETHASELCKREFPGGRVLRCESCTGDQCNRESAATTIIPKTTSLATKSPIDTRTGWDALAEEIAPIFFEALAQRRGPQCLLGHKGEWHTDTCPWRSKCATLSCDIAGIVWYLKICAPHNATDAFYGRICTDFDANARLMGRELCQGDMCNADGPSGVVVAAAPRIGTRCMVGMNAELYNHTCDEGCASITCELGDTGAGVVVVRTCGFPGVCNVARNLLCKGLGGRVSDCAECTGNYCNGMGGELNSPATTAETAIKTATEEEDEKEKNKTKKDTTNDDDNNGGTEELMCVFGVGDKLTNRSCMTSNAKNPNVCATLVCDLGAEKEVVVKSCAPLNRSDEYWLEGGKASKECAELNATLLPQASTTCDYALCNNGAMAGDAFFYGTLFALLLALMATHQF